MNLDAIGIVSHDIKKSVTFYKILGLALEQKGGPDHFEATTPSGVRIMLDTVALVKQLNPKWEKPTGCGVVLCFKQKTPAQVDKLYENFMEGKFTSVKEPWDAFWGQRYASVSDPDGNQIDLFADL